MDVISLSAIKKAKEVLEGKINAIQRGQKDDSNTLSRIEDGVGNLPGYVNSAQASIVDECQTIKSKLADGISTITGKLTDRLDVNVSSRASAADWTADRARKVDKLDVNVSSRVSRTDFNLWKDEQNILRQTTDEVLNRMDGRIDRPLSDLARKSTQDEINARTKTFLPPAQKVVFTSPGIHKWQCPKGVEKIIVEIGGASGGGGGSGGGANYKGISSKASWHSVPGAAGGRGGYARITLRSTPGQSYDIQVGGKGTGGSAGPKGTGEDIYDNGCYYCQGQPGGDGTAGGYSSFGDYIAYGGGGGKGGEGSIAYDKPIDKWEAKALGGSSGNVSGNFLTFADKIIIEPETGKDSTPKKYVLSDGSKTDINGVKGASTPLLIWGHTMQGGAGGNAAFANNYPYAYDGQKGEDGTDGVIIIHYA
ncbi:hypothetical protein ACLGL1_01195 [Peptococcus simiae]|uniref:hypothetical protein n=1 Tax=Peptococcus simiae TaxID=1643805 RepID=UPI00397F1A4D